jgi:hypothetical protein
MISFAPYCELQYGNMVCNQTISSSRFKGFVMQIPHMQKRTLFSRTERRNAKETLDNNKNLFLTLLNNWLLNQSPVYFDFNRLIWIKFDKIVRKKDHL